MSIGLKHLMCVVCAAVMLLAAVGCSSKSSEGDAESKSGKTSSRQTAADLAPDGSSIKASDYSKAAVWAVAAPASAGDAAVTVTVYLGNNPKFEMIGMRVIYDAALKPVVGDAQSGFAYEDGDVTSGSISVTSLNEDERIAGYAVMNNKAMTADGSLFTFELALPQNAQSGDSYLLECEIVDFLLGQSQLDVTGVTTSFTLS